MLKKLPKELTTVTRLSKALALILFVALPFTGFYYGRLYQQSLDAQFKPPLMKMGQLMDQPKAPTGDSLNVDLWKEFKDPSGEFAFNFPQNWLISFEQSATYKDRMDIKLMGPEGEIDVIWADSYGGACDNPGYEKMTIKSGEETVCHAAHVNVEGKPNNTEFWQLQKPFQPNKGLGIYVNAYSFNKNREIILKIIQSFNFDLTK